MMADARFTKGPWRLSDSGDNTWTVCEPDKPFRHSHFATVSVGNMWGDEGKANARIIAAAPDLYEALCGMLEYTADLNPAQGYPETDHEAVNAARAALAKARGES